MDRRRGEIPSRSLVSHQQVRGRQEQQREDVSKWPLLGDLPLLGSLFRSRQSTRSKDELVILVTPRVLDDDQGGVFGYGYRPATQQATELMQKAF